MMETVDPSRAAGAENGGAEQLDGLLRITRVRREADSVVSVTLASPDGAPLPRWEPGSHVEVELPSGLIRHYSLCGDVDDHDSWTVAVLLEAEGRGGSSEVHTQLRVGHTIRVRGPRNKFPLVDAPEYLFLAGGIGITPILPMVRRVAGEAATWRLIYCGRRRSSMAFLSELDDIAHACTTGSIEILAADETGRPDLAAHLGDTAVAAAVYACGPPGLLAATEEHAESTGHTLHVERFGAGTAVADGIAQDWAPFEVELAASGQVLAVPSNRSLIDVVRDVRSDVLSSCEEGYCGSCETRVLAGTPEHHDTILTQDERDAGETMMICVGRCAGDRLVLDL